LIITDAKIGKAKQDLFLMV